jgi:hypothetical protein
MRLSSASLMLPPTQTGARYPSSTFGHIIHYLESHRHAIASIDTLAQEFCLKRRPLYEFITICCTFGICQRPSTDTVHWLGIERSRCLLDTFRKQAREGLSDDDFDEILTSSVGLSVSDIAIAIVRLFFLLHVQALDLRKVSRILANNKAKYKTVLRKVYTVAGGLEFAGIVRKTTVASEIQLQVPLDWSTAPAQMDLMAMLNSNQEMEEARIWARRRRAFDGACSERFRVPVDEPPIAEKIQFPPLLALIAQFR